MEKFSVEKAKELLDTGMGQAQTLLKDPSGVDELMVQLEKKVKDIPVAGSVLADVPRMISMVKSYITREYTQVSPKVIVSMVSAFLYVVRKKDLIPDKIPVVGFLDDIAVIGLALKFVEPELKAFEQWRSGQTPQSLQARQAEEPEPAPEAGEPDMESV